MGRCIYMNIIEHSSIFIIIWFNEVIIAPSLIQLYMEFKNTYLISKLYHLILGFMFKYQMWLWEIINCDFVFILLQFSVLLHQCSDCSDAGGFDQTIHQHVREKNALDFQRTKWVDCPCLQVTLYVSWIIRACVLLRLYQTKLSRILLQVSYMGFYALPWLDWPLSWEGCCR